VTSGEDERSRFAPGPPSSLPRQGPEEIEVRVLSAERLTFFSDAVVAIAMTLLALDLPVPKGDTAGQFWHSVVTQRDDYLAFVISFLVIGGHWRSHHRIFRYVTDATRRLITWNLAWLLMLVITPFATRVIAADGSFQARFTLYAVVQILAGAFYQLMLLEITRNGLYRTDTPLEKFAAARYRSLTIGLAFAVGTAVSFFTEWAYLALFLVPFLGNALGRRRHFLD
jgi:uncharacterized membrane protein